MGKDGGGGGRRVNIKWNIIFWTCKGFTSLLLSEQGKNFSLVALLLVEDYYLQEAIIWC